MESDLRTKLFKRFLQIEATVFLLAMAACATVGVRPLPFQKIQYGKASWYGENFRGKVTASGEVFYPEHLTAAHKTLPLGTWVKVENLYNHRTVIVRINDRGPYVKGRVIDLSKRAAEVIRMVRRGVVKVRIAVLPVERHPWRRCFNNKCRKRLRELLGEEYYGPDRVFGGPETTLRTEDWRSNIDIKVAANNTDEPVPSGSEKLILNVEGVVPVQTQTNPVRKKRRTHWRQRIKEAEAV